MSQNPSDAPPGVPKGEFLGRGLSLLVYLLLKFCMSQLKEDGRTTTLWPITIWTHDCLFTIILLSQHGEIS